MVLPLLCLGIVFVSNAVVAQPTSSPNVTVVRVSLEQEMRKAIRAPAGRHIPLGAIPENGVFRLGVLEGPDSTERSTVRVYVGEEVVVAVETLGNSDWLDIRIPLGAYENAPANPTIFIEGRGDHWVGPLKVFTPETSLPNVVVFVVDSLRKDHLGCYGYGRDTSPNIDAFAKEAYRFTRCIASSSWTRPAVASLLSGVYPNRHGGQGNRHVLRGGIPWLPNLLSSEGYTCEALVATPDVLPVWGFGPGFARFVDANALLQHQAPSSHGTFVDEAVTMLTLLEGLPWFFYVHGRGAQAPYAPPPAYLARMYPPTMPSELEAQRKVEMIAKYDGAIAYADAQFGDLLEALKARGQYDNTMIVVLGDHGEEFWEHGGTAHSKTLYGEVVEIPLLIKLPRQTQGKTIDALVALQDIAPTVVDYLGLPTAESFQGRSMRPALEAGAEIREVAVAALHTEEWWLQSAIGPGEKYIEELRTGNFAWFNLAEDPREQSPLDVSPSGERNLALVSKAVSIDQASGLHLLIKGGKENTTVEGTLFGTGDAPYNWIYLGGQGVVARQGDPLRFRFSFAPGVQEKVQEVLPGLTLDPRVAHLFIPLAADAQVTVNITANGKAIPPWAIELGNNGAASPLRGEEIPLALLTVTPQTMAHNTLSDRFGVYLRYVAPEETVLREAFNEAGSGLPQP